MTIREYTRYDAGEILPLYEAVGWVNYTRHPEGLEQAYRHSLLTLAAYEDERLAGILRAVGDGCSVVLIQDLLVHPDWQRRGIGAALLREAVARFENVYQLELMTDDRPGTVAFYRSLGFRRASEFGCAAFLKMNAE